MDIFTRTERLLGREGVDKLRGAKVILFGVGGVGSYAAEALGRAGVGDITLVDGDVVSATNLNRQLVALTSTVGKPKAEVMAERIRDINPAAHATAVNTFYTLETRNEFSIEGYDYVLDAIDMVTAKLDIIERCFKVGVPVVSSMGTGNKLDPSLFRVCDIYETVNCPLARKLRKELRKRGVTSLPVVFSPEETAEASEGEGKVGSLPYVPPVAGMLLAGKAIADLAGVRL